MYSVHSSRNKTMKLVQIKICLKFEYIGKPTYSDQNYNTACVTYCLLYLTENY